MTMTFDAVYENGVLKPTQEVPLKEHQKVRVTIDARPTLDVETGALASTYGFLGWTDSHEALAPFALDPELDPQEGP